MNKVFLLVLFFLFPATQISVGFAHVGQFASTCAEVDLVSDANTEIQLAMAAAPAPAEREKSPVKPERVDVSPTTMTILVLIMILMIVIGVLRFRVMANENDLL